MIITIDGPTASGKSTVGRLLAQKVNFFYLSSGLLFRGLAYCLMHECNYKQEEMEDPKNKDLKFCINRSGIISYMSNDNGERFFLRDRDVTKYLKTPDIDQYSSIIATSPLVREILVDLQRDMVKGLNAVVEGRDCGSVVFPRASIKFFLTASIAIRAERWAKDRAEKGFKFTPEQAFAEVESRDARDAERQIAPLIIPKDAFVVDNSNMTIAQTIKSMLDIMNESGIKIPLHN